MVYIKKEEFVKAIIDRSNDKRLANFTSIKKVEILVETNGQEVKVDFVVTVRVDEEEADLLDVYISVENGEAKIVDIMCGTSTFAPNA